MPRRSARIDAASLETTARIELTAGCDTPYGTVAEAGGFVFVTDAWSSLTRKIDPATKTFLVRSVIDNSDHHIRPGMIGRVVFVRRVIPDAVAAPLFAIVDKGGERIVFVEKDGIAQSRTISIGMIQGDRVQITSGLDVGDHLIVKGHTEVEDGMKVIAQ